jgi:hypothetical protein
VTGRAAGCAFTLTFRDGVVIANDIWTENTTRSRGGGGTVLYGAGSIRSPEIESRTDVRQRIAIRLPNRDVFLERRGHPLPVASSQDVTLVAVRGENRKRDVNVALVNRSSRSWHWIGGPRGPRATTAGALVRSPLIATCDALNAVGAFLLSTLIAYFAFLRGASVLTWIACVVLGLPVLAGLSLAFWLRRPNRIGIEIARLITAQSGLPAARWGRHS